MALEPIAEADAVAPLWLELEKRGACPFYRSWGWIGCWLRSLPPETGPRLFSARDGSRIVALAVLVPAGRVRHGFLRSNGLYLNETGDPALDRLTVEYNGFLLAPDADAETLRHCIGWLVESRAEWDELFLSGLDPETGRELADIGTALGLRTAVRDRKPSAYVDLERVRESGADYLAALSRNTRYQIRRSLRRYGADGEAGLVVAGNVEEALAFLAELKDLHQAYWVRRGHAGSFASPVFEGFHGALIRDRFDLGEIQMAKIAAGARVIGYLYNFVHRRHVYTYQSGFRYESDAKLKPGIVSHYLAIEYNLAGGAAIYDFLAGEGQHKQSLGTVKTEMVWLVLQRDRAKFRIEDALRALKRRLAPG